MLFTVSISCKVYKCRPAIFIEILKISLLYLCHYGCDSQQTNKELIIIQCEGDVRSPKTSTEPLTLCRNVFKCVCQADKNQVKDHSLPLGHCEIADNSHATHLIPPDDMWHGHQSLCL